jgi:hypothetical protein
MKKMDQNIDAVRNDSAFGGLYKTGAAAALIAGLIFRRNLDAEWLLLRSLGIVNSGPDLTISSIGEWFTLLQQQPLLGLTLLNVFDLVNYALIGLIILALAFALRRANPTCMVIAAALGAVGVTVYFASNQAFSLLALSKQYANAASESQRVMIQAAGQAALTIHQSASYAGSGIYLSFLLVSAAGLLIAFAMLRTNLFSTGTAVVGIIANSLQLSYYIFLVFAPALVAVPISISAIFLLIWYIQVGVRLWILGGYREAGLEHSIKSKDAAAVCSSQTSLGQSVVDG